MLKRRKYWPHLSPQNEVLYKRTATGQAIKKTNPRKAPRLRPLSLSPLKPEAALAAFMQVDPAKVFESNRSKGKVPYETPCFYAG